MTCSISLKNKHKLGPKGAVIGNLVPSLCCTSEKGFPGALLYNWVTAESTIGNKFQLFFALCVTQ